MSKISSTSKIHKSRVHNNYVEQNHKVTGANSVDRVNPVDGVSNSAEYSSGNYLYATDAFYDKLDKLSNEYRRFYHSERDLEQAIDEIDRNGDKLSEYMSNLIEKYNRTVRALQSLEEEIGTNKMTIIKDILSSYEGELEAVGISIVNENELYLNTEKFIEQVVNSEDALKTLFRPIRGMITKLYKTFRSIKLPSNEAMENQYDKQDNGLSRRDYSGILMDVKS